MHSSSQKISADPTSVVLWLVPFNYIWLIRLFDKGRASISAHDARATKLINLNGKVPEYVGVKEQSECAQQPLMSQPEGCKTARKRLLERMPKLFWTSVIIAVIALLQWCLSLASLIIHWEFTWSSNPRTQTYFEIPRAIENPATIGRMPEACLDWLKSGGVQKSRLVDIEIEQFIFCLIFTIQFIACSTLIVPTVRAFLGPTRRVQYAPIYRMVEATATMGMACLGLPALATGAWILGKVVFGTSDITLRYTNDLNVTGGCTFGIVNMDKRWGYWDVEYERPLRLVMSGFGAA